MGYRYIGAKNRIMEDILPAIENLVGTGAYVADLMCGTSAVSTELRKRGFRVTANDLMTYSYHHARVALLFTSEPAFSNSKKFIKEFSKNSSNGLLPLAPYEQILDALNNVPPIKGYFFREFSSDGSPKNNGKPRNYFSPHNAKKIDGMRKWIHELARTRKIDKLEHSLLLHDLIMAANDVANIAGTYGHYLSKLRGRAQDNFMLSPTQLVIRKDKGAHRVLKGYAEEVAKEITCDLCYIDPPYMKRQYAANYHILETLAREDEPIAVGVSGLRPWRDQYSNFCTKTKIQNSFRRIFTDMTCTHFFISYSEDGLLSLNELKNLFSEFGTVKVEFSKHKRFRSNNSSLSPRVTEYLIHLLKKC